MNISYEFKFICLCKQNAIQRSAYCFIFKQNGFSIYLIPLLSIRSNFKQVLKVLIYSKNREGLLCIKLLQFTVPSYIIMFKSLMQRKVLLDPLIQRRGTVATENHIPKHLAENKVVICTPITISLLKYTISQNSNKYLHLLYSIIYKILKGRSNN